MPIFSCKSTMRMAVLFTFREKQSSLSISGISLEFCVTWSWSRQSGTPVSGWVCWKVDCGLHGLVHTNAVRKKTVTWWHTCHFKNNNFWSPNEFSFQWHWRPNNSPLSVTWWQLVHLPQAANFFIFTHQMTFVSGMPLVTKILATMKFDGCELLLLVKEKII